MNAKRLTAYRVVTTLVLLVSAPAGLFSPHSLLSITYKCLGDCRACYA